MADRKQLVAGNWKMNGQRADGLALARGVAELSRQPYVCDLLVCPPFTLLAAVGEALAGSNVALGGQDCHAGASGAFTGCISAEMLRDSGCSYVIAGHPERRHTCGESDGDVRAKTEAAMKKVEQEPKQKNKKARWQSVAVASTGIVTTLGVVAMMGPKLPVWLGE